VRKTGETRDKEAISPPLWRWMGRAHTLWPRQHSRLLDRVAALWPAGVWATEVVMKGLTAHMRAGMDEFRYGKRGGITRREEDSGALM